MKKYCFIKQEDKMDCGIASLATILSYYNKQYSIKELKYMTMYNKNIGSNFFELYSIAIKFEFKPIALILESINSFKYIKLPCIGQIEVANNITHFIVIYKVERNFVIVADPAKGIRRISIQHFQNCFTSKVLLI